jgi:hypothetical protein
MRKTVSFILVLIISLVILHPRDAQAQMPAKARAFLTIAGYGAGGGALLGLASMAFGNSTRAVAQGASLGLYAGILFGTYVLVSHHQKQVGSYDDDGSPYQKSSDIYGEGYNSEDGGGSDQNSQGGFFDRFRQMQEHVHSQSFTVDSVKKKGSSLPPIQFNILQYNF